VLEQVGASWGDVSDIVQRRPALGEHAIDVNPIIVAIDDGSTAFKSHVLLKWNIRIPGVRA